MKLLIVLALLTGLLTGCGSAAPGETLGNIMEEIPQLPPPREVQVTLPGEAAIPTMEQSGQRYYLCDDYEITLGRQPSGDLAATVKDLSGYAPEDLTVMETDTPGARRYDFVWTTTGEQGQQLGRAAVLDDGNYHYTLSVLRDADTTESLQVSWNQVFSSFSLG